MFLFEVYCSHYKMNNSLLNHTHLNSRNFRAHVTFADPLREQLVARTIGCANNPDFLLKFDMCGKFFFRRCAKTRLRESGK